MILPILAAVICLAQMIKINNQAMMPIPKEYVFAGEYSYDGERWYPYSEDIDISAFDGDLVVKGHFDSDLPEGGMLNFYTNHIGVSIYVNGELIYLDAASEIKSYGMDLMASMCGKSWEQLLCPEIKAEDEVEIHLINYHNHGNENAYKELLSSFLMTPPDNTILEVYLKSYIKPFEMAGYTVFDVMTLYFSDELLVVKTYGALLCLILAIYFIGLIICSALKERYKKIAEILIAGSGIINLIIIVLATLGKVLLYDMMFYWELVQCIISLGLIVLCVLELRREQVLKKEFILYISVNIAILIDMTDVFYNSYYSGICFKIAYVIMLIFYLFYGIKQVLQDHQASIKNEKLKAENLISFRTELEHIQKYLRLEKLRFQDELEILYDIHVQDFMLPALSVQPLIENAVKHGVGQKVGGGIVSVHSYETDEYYVVRIEDDGVGFEEGEYTEDGGTHVGIENTKKRLDMMINAKLEIKSTKGEGTKATILIPKRRD